MSKNKKIFITVTPLFIIVFLVYLLQIPFRNMYSKHLIGTIYLYQGSHVELINSRNKLFTDFTKEISNIINNDSLCLDTVDGVIDIQGNGVPIETDKSKYAIEVNFTKKQTLFLLNGQQNNISTLYISLNDNCLYIYKYSENKDLTFIAGYCCKEDSLDNLYSMVKDYLSSNS